MYLNVLEMRRSLRKGCGAFVLGPQDGRRGRLCFCLFWFQWFCFYRIMLYDDVLPSKVRYLDDVWLFFFRWWLIHSVVRCQWRQYLTITDPIWRLTYYRSLHAPFDDYEWWGVMCTPDCVGVYSLYDLWYRPLVRTSTPELYWFIRYTVRHTCTTCSFYSTPPARGWNKTPRFG